MRRRSKKRALFESLLAIAAICLIFSFYLMVTGYAFTTTEARATVKWDAAGNSTIYYLTACQDGTLRALTDGRITAIGSDGAQLWSMSIPPKWWVGSKYFDPAVDVAPDGTVYVYLRANVTQAAIEHKLPYTYAGEYTMDMDDHNKRLMDAYAGTEFANSLDERVVAISSHGEVLWNLPLATGLYNATIAFRNGTVYVYHGYELTAISPEGAVLWSVDDVGASPAVDDAGRVYAATPIHGDLDPNTRTLSGIIKAYYANGTAIWKLDLGEPATMGQGTVPLYDHDTLYVPLSNGVAAVATNGTIQWVKHYNVSTAMLEQAPFDGAGNIYLRTFDAGIPLSEYTVNGETYYSYTSSSYPIAGTHISILRPDGTELATVDGSRAYAAVKDGVGYRVDVLYPESERRLDVLESAAITAVDLKSGATLWSSPMAPGEAATSAPATSILNASNARSILAGNDLKSAKEFNARSTNFTPVCVSGDCSVRILPGKDVIYAGFWTYNYQAPAIYGRSIAAYSGGLYAFDTSGKLLWSRPLDALISSMYERNGSIFYSTGSGSMSAATVDFATGLAMAAALYLFIRFIAVGAISRARGAVSTNENRNAVLKYVVDNPGSTMYEIARNMGLNKGTVRYHLFILSVNHRIAAHKADRKYVRYFPNAGSYSKDEQQLMSLLRRDTIRRVMQALLKQPGLSNVELSKELNVPESAMSKHMKELYSMGIVEKRQMEGGVSYCVKDTVRGLVVKALESTSS